MARQRERVIKAGIPKKEDSPIYRDCHVVNWYKHPKIVKASRGIKEIQQELHIDSKIRRVFGNLTASSSDLEEDRYMFVPTLIGFLLLYGVVGIVMGFLTWLDPNPEYGYWTTAITIFMVFGVPMSLIGASWRAYIDLYPRALWRYWWKVKSEEREPISLTESVEYLMNLFLDTEKIEDQVKAFGWRLHRYNKLRKEAGEYLDNIDAAIIDTDLEKVALALEKREEVVIEKLRVVEEKEAEAENFWPDLYRCLQEAKKDLKQLETFRSKHLNSDGLGNLDDLERYVKEEEDRIADKVIDSVMSLYKKNLSAKEAVDAVLEEKKRSKEEPIQGRPSEASLKRIQAMKLTEEGEIEEPPK